MKEILTKFAELLKVKTIVTFVVVTVFSILALQGRIEADNVILSVGYRPAPVAPRSGNVHIVGDADKVGNLRSVIWQAWDVCMKL